MNDPNESSRTSGSLLASFQGRAAQMLAGRMLILERPSFIAQMPGILDPSHSGLVVCGAKSERQTRNLRASHSGLLLEDPAAYEKEVATEDAPFRLPKDVLWGADLGSVLDEQLERGASIGVAPTRYIQAGDADALRAVMRGAAALDRDDVLIPLPVSTAWLRKENLRQLVAVIRRIPHPVALTLGAQLNPLRDVATLERLYELLGEVSQTSPVGLWRIDLAGFDAMARGAAFAGIGAGGSLRHLVPAGEPAKSSGGGGPNYPSVLAPGLLTFKLASFLDRIYANSPPACPCSQCGGATLPSFQGATDEVKTAAHSHNAATWTAWLSSFLGCPTLPDRQNWWRDACLRAVNAHEQENERLRQPGALKPDPVLKKWAGMDTKRKKMTP